MTTVLCTLYNSLYLDKGLVLYDSLCASAKDFKLYVLCMDDKCFEVLTDLNQENHIPVKLSDFEAGDTALLEAKGNRPMGEYCWTCSSSFIRYVLKHFGEEICTYVDADMYFYTDPQVLIDEMLIEKKSVMITPHRFTKDKADSAKVVGTYCVEFNTFLNDNDGLNVLEFWRNKCLESVAQMDDGIHYGDQKYLDEIAELFECVHVCQNEGAGLAQWNLPSYTLTDQREYAIYNPSGKKVRIVFYHYQNVAYVTSNIIKIGPSKDDGIDRNFVKYYYKPYLKKIKEKKQMLDKEYGVNTLILVHPAKVQRYSAIKKTFLGRIILYIRLIRNNKIIVRI